MGRYADVDYLLKNNAVKMDWSGQKWVSEVSLVSAINLNVVPVVRCKNCKHRNWETNGCNRNPCVEPWNEDDFCSYGEDAETTL